MVQLGQFISAVQQALTDRKSESTVSSSSVKAQVATTSRQLQQSDVVADFLQPHVLLGAKVPGDELGEHLRRGEVLFLQSRKVELSREANERTMRILTTFCSL